MPASSINSVTERADDLMSNSRLICFIGLHVRSLPQANTFCYLFAIP